MCRLSQRNKKVSKLERRLLQTQSAGCTTSPMRANCSDMLASSQQQQPRHFKAERPLAENCAAEDS